MRADHCYGPCNIGTISLKTVSKNFGSAQKILLCLGSYIRRRLQPPQSKGASVRYAKGSKKVFECKMGACKEHIPLSSAGHEKRESPWTEGIGCLAVLTRPALVEALASVYEGLGLGRKAVEVDRREPEDKGSIAHGGKCGLAIVRLSKRAGTVLLAGPTVQAAGKPIFRKMEQGDLNMSRFPGKAVLKIVLKDARKPLRCSPLVGGCADYENPGLRHGL